MFKQIKIVAHKQKRMFFHCALFVRLRVRHALLATQVKKQVMFILGRKLLLASKGESLELSKQSL